MAPATRGKDQIVIPASSVIVFRRGPEGDPELLLVQRAEHLSFAGAATVFPGGKVHKTDAKLAETLSVLPLDEATARIAGIREVLEETGLLVGTHQRPRAEDAAAARTMLADKEDLAPVLARFGWTLDIDCLTPFARWLPSFKSGRIFDTRFYLADMGSGRADLSPDCSENTRLFWATARQALAQIQTGAIQSIYPTRRNLERLAQFASFSEAEAHARATPIKIISPWIEHHDGVAMLCIPNDSGYPVTTAPLSQISIR